MRLLDQITGVGELREAQARLQESLQQERDTNALLEESIRHLELEMEDEGWQRLVGGGEREFSREGLRKIASNSRLMFLKNPLINRAVLVQSYYVWAQGVTITSDDEATQALITEFVEDPANQAELTSHQARTMKEQDLQVSGNLFFVLFSDMATGAVKVRTIPLDEITEIISDPEDLKTPWFYKREWTVSATDIGTGVSTEKTLTAYYPDIRYSPVDAGRVDTIGGKPVNWDSPVYHVRVGGLSDMRFGVPEVYSAIDWAKAYKSFLEDWATIVRSYAKFAWNLNTTGGAKAVAAAKARLGTTASTSQRDTNPTTVGSVFVGSGAEMQPIRTAGATTSAEDGRRLLLMVASSFGLPETFFGDVQTGNLATAKSLDRPTELKFRDRQELWRSILDTILQYAVAKSKRAANGGLRLANAPEKAKITIKFPPILEHDVAQTVQAIVAAATLDGKSPAGTIDWKTTARLVLEALGVADIEEVLALVADEREEMQAAKEEQAAAMAAQVAQNASPAMKAAVETLREALKALHERMAA